MYACDNDVVDHQVVSMEFPSGATGTFTVTAFTPYARRQTRIFGSAGCLEGDGVRISLHDFVTGEMETVHTGPGAGSGNESDDESRGGRHDEADDALADAFVEALATGDPSLLSSDGGQSLDSHRVVWAAERARVTGRVVTLALPTPRPDVPAPRPGGPDARRGGAAPRPGAAPVPHARRQRR